MIKQILKISGTDACTQPIDCIFLTNHLKDI